MLLAEISLTYLSSLVQPISMIEVRRWDYRSLMYALLLTCAYPQGDGDSEIALVIEDDDMVESTMDGRPFMASRFATTLRRKLFRGENSSKAYSICRRC